MSGSIRVEFHDPQQTWASVTLSHAGKFNAMSRSMWLDLAQAFNRLSALDHVRCVVLRGEGGHFCSGGDIAEYPSFRFSEEGLTHFHEREVWGGLQAVLSCPVPVIASIEGNCLGAGLEMASCCDIRVAGTGSKFGAPIARLGFPMAPREADLVMRAVGRATASEMLFEAAVLSAAEMRERGFLNRVVEDAQVLGTGHQRAMRIASLAPQAARANKRALAAISHGTEPLPQLVASAYRYADSPEHREGIQAFLDKRQPVF